MLKFTMQKRTEKHSRRLSAHDLKQREITRNFNHLAKQVLTPTEREALHRAIRRYQKNGEVADLHQSMIFILSTSEKQKLFPYVRSMISTDDRYEFDRLTESHQKIRRESYLVLDEPPTRRGNTLLHPNSAKRATTYHKNVRVLTINNKKSSETLGFSIRGGLEYGLGIYVSQVDAFSAADDAGLEVGDQILEVNNIDLNNVALSGAVGVLTGSNKLKLIINRMRKVPEWKKSKETTMWYDVRRKKLVALPADERLMDHETIRERQVTLRILKPSDFIGMNVRGGNEYGLGIYVSRLDPGGLAEKYGVCLGDQIVAVNKQSFENVSHSSAVEFLRAHSTLQLTLKGVGRFPAYKEVYQEYTWSENTIESRRPDARLNLNDTPINSQYSLSPQKSMAQRNMYIQNPNVHHGQHRLSLQKEVLLPRKQDITYASVYEDPWTSSGFGDEEHNNSSETANTSNGRHFRRNDHQSSESDSGQDDYDAFLRQRRKQESEGLYSNSTTLQHRHYPQEAHTSFGSTPLLHKNDDYTVHTYVQPAQHHVLHRSSPDIQSTHTFEEYAPIRRHPKTPQNTNNSGIVYVRNPEQNGRHSDGPVYSAVQKSGQKSVENPSTSHRYKSKSQASLNPTETSYRHKTKNPALTETNNRYKSKSQPSLVSNDIGSRLSAYDDFHMYNRSANLNHRFQEPEVDYTDTDSAGVSHVINGAKSESGSSTNVYSDVKTVNNKDVDVLENAHLSDEEYETNVMNTSIERLENRKSHLGSFEINRIKEQSIGTPVYKSPPKSPSKKTHDTSTWQTIKKKITGSGKEKKKDKRRDYVARDRGKFATVFGSQVMNSQYVDNYNMMMVEDTARSLLNEDECSAVIRHVKNYHDKKDLDRLVDSLIHILDTPEKFQLLKDIRGVIYPYHVALFDNKVHKYNIKEYERMPTKLHLPLNHNHQSSSAPNQNLMTTVIDDDGHFQIKTINQHNRDVRHEKEVINVMRSSQEIATDSEDGEEERSYDFTRQESTRNSDDHTVVVHISKHKTHLGLILSGGDGQNPSPVKVETILKNSAAADDGNIKSGMILLAVDDKSLRFKSLNQVLAALKKSYNNKSSVVMKLVFKRPLRY